MVTLQHVTARWKMEILGPTIPGMVGASAVLFRVSPLRWARYLGSRAYARAVDLLMGRHD
jgi:hypothetical protein